METWISVFLSLTCENSKYYKTFCAILTNHPSGILSKCRLMVNLLIFLLIKYIILITPLSIFHCQVMTRAGLTTNVFKGNSGVCLWIACWQGLSFTNRFVIWNTFRDVVCGQDGAEAHSSEGVTAFWFAQEHLHRLQKEGSCRSLTVRINIWSRISTLPFY